MIATITLYFLFVALITMQHPLEAVPYKEVLFQAGLLTLLSAVVVIAIASALT